MISKLCILRSIATRSGLIQIPFFLLTCSRRNEAQAFTFFHFFSSQARYKRYEERSPCNIVYNKEAPPCYIEPVSPCHSHVSLNVGRSRNPGRRDIIVSNEQKEEVYGAMRESSFPTGYIQKVNFF